MKSCVNLLLTKVDLLEALIKLPKSIPATLKELVLTVATGCDQILHGNLGCALGGGDHGCLEAICDLGHRLEKLTLDCIVTVEPFLAFALKSQPSSPWRHLRYLSIIDSEFHYPAAVAPILDTMIMNLWMSILCGSLHTIFGVAIIRPGPRATMIGWAERNTKR